MADPTPEQRAFYVVEVAMIPCGFDFVIALYNEIEPFAADWLERLVEAGHVAPGRVERRSISDLKPQDFEGVTQAHFFAGIGGWSHALRLAGWPDDLPVWTGSCPCQPFSVAGKRKGKTDERHLWPVWFKLIRERRPAIVLGEQVASPDGLDWLDSVSADLEGEGYAFAAADLCAAGVGAPHARQRLYFVAYAHGRPGDIYATRRREGQGVLDAPRDGAPRVMADPNSGARDEGRSLGGGSDPRGDAEPRPGPGGCGIACGCWDPNAWHRKYGLAPGEICSNAGLVGNASREGLEGRGADVRVGPSDAGGGGGESPARGSSASRVMVDAGGSRAGRHPRAAAAAAQTEGPGEGDQPRRLGDGPLAPGSTRAPAGSFPGAVGGFWGGAEWIFCTDGKWRPVEPGSFPLAHGVPGRMGRLRGYGNAIVPQQAAVFVSAVREAMEGVRS